MIFKDVTDTILDTLRRFKGINTVRYQGDDFNNAQHNYNTLQAYLDNIQYHQINITTGIFRAEYNIYILGKPEDNLNENILKIQDEAYNAALNIIAYMDNNPIWRGILRVHDYSIISLADYTAQRNAGVKLSLILEIPNGVDLCTYEDWFRDEPIEDEQEPELDIKTITLPIKNKC